MHKFILTLLTLLSLSAHAGEKYFLLTPSCLLKNIPAAAYKTLASNPSLSLIETEQSGLHAAMEAKHMRRTAPCGGFMDVTNEWQPSKKSAAQLLKKYEMQAANKLSANPYITQYPNQVNQLLNQMNPEQIWSDLLAFSNTSPDQFPDRYPNSQTGIKAAVWLQNKIAAMVSEYHREDVSIYTVATGTRYQQPSVVVKIGHANLPGIVIGAHMDTYRQTLLSGVKPGADDDGSGSMTVMAVARTLLASGMQFKKPIYIIWYAAEEQGLVGSQFVVRDFVNHSIAVEAVLQFDMTGYAYRNDPALWLITDYIDNSLTDFVATLINTYVKKPVYLTRCGYACSDHASWTAAKIPSAFPIEAQFGRDNPYIHTSHDTINLLSLAHMTDYAKLGVAFAVELAAPVE
jgi:leucyl aminopeptidase